MCMHTYHDAHVEIRGQLCISESLFPTLNEFWGLNFGHQA